MAHFRSNKTVDSSEKITMETYVEFLSRIDSFEKSEINFGDEYFECNPSLSKKVNNDNTFADFYGDTVVFGLDDATKARLAECVDSLYAVALSCFCERLAPNTFHVTLHDLSNSPNLRDISDELFFNELKVIEKATELRDVDRTAIKLKSKYIFNMVDTSLVLGLYPADERDHKRLMKLYGIFDDVKKPNYPLTPHITLAYYNVNGFDKRAAEALKIAVDRLNKDIAIDVNVNSLYYQKFTSMNDYIDVIRII